MDVNDYSGLNLVQEISALNVKYFTFPQSGNPNQPISIVGPLTCVASFLLEFQLTIDISKGHIFLL